MTATELRTLLVNRLSRMAGGSPRRWRLAIGEVTIYSLSTHPHCNWAVNPRGSIGENDAIETVLDSVRLEHPHAVRG